MLLIVGFCDLCFCAKLWSFESTVWDLMSSEKNINKWKVFHKEFPFPDCYLPVLYMTAYRFSDNVNNVVYDTVC